ncbi:hypothetical protein HYH02_006259 [Chlamydomonas schloesseri]|uniref:Uncharacterized protein n=1 Tax=Chlamydomonas schloesseri TaxID=2026947 RepID=A0A836B6B0_9CHLO|nr:hypothetical protein HYH02_006259 [Chlamydomonas schloesseri]|eukprot:KAG2448911.1 hypothetical protein HYH02_006259 [Chlamydomonas schloesseri]
MEKPENIVKDVENYLQTTKIDKVVKEMVVSVLHNKPTSVEDHMVKHLVGKVKQSSGEAAIATAEDGSGVAVVHPDPGTQAYLASKGVADMLASIVQRLAAERPDDVPGFIASYARHLHQH